MNYLNRDTLRILPFFLVRKGLTYALDVLY